MLRCYITDRHKLAGGESLIDAIARSIDVGVDWIQIREKDLTGFELYQLALKAVDLAKGTRTKILVNTRADVALASGAGGVHLPSQSPSPRAWRAIVPPGFLIGVSCHLLSEVRDAEQEGADYALFGPVFSPLSKTSDLSPRGLEGLAEAARAVGIPVLALGGITKTNAPVCREAGAAGIAAISLFQSSSL